MRSTNPIYEEDTENTSINKTGKINNLVFTVLETTDTLGKIYTYQTGCLTVTSIKDTIYVFVLYCDVANKIITEPLKDRTGK